MKLITALWLAMWLTPAMGQDSATSKVNQIMTYSYPMESSGIIYLSPTTSQLPGKGATVRVTRGSVGTDVDVLVDHMPPPQSLGDNSTTYVVWLISPDGETLKAGELLRNGDTGILHTTTNWGAFGVFITAEPDSCGECASPNTVVLASDVCGNGLHPERWATISCGNPSGQCSVRPVPVPVQPR